MFGYLKNIGKRAFDTDILFNFAFGKLGSFSLKPILAKRRHHASLLEAEFEEYELKRRDYMERRKTNATQEEE